MSKDAKNAQKDASSARGQGAEKEPVVTAKGGTPAAVPPPLPPLGEEESVEPSVPAAPVFIPEDDNAAGPLGAPVPLELPEDIESPETSKKSVAPIVMSDAPAEQAARVTKAVAPVWLPEVEEDAAARASLAAAPVEIPAEAEIPAPIEGAAPQALAGAWLEEVASADDALSPSGPFWVRHPTGATVGLFLGVSLLLAIAPVPDFLRPVLLGNETEVRSVVSRVFKKPRMTLASLESEVDVDAALDLALEKELAKEKQGGLAAGSTDKADGDTASLSPLSHAAGEGGESHLAAAVQPDGSARAAMSPGREMRVRNEVAPTEQTRTLRRLASMLDAPGVQVDNPCVDFNANGCARTALDPFFASLDAVDQKEEGSHATIVTLGNSLIASDHVTDVVREHLVARFGSGGSGFLLPDRLSKVAGRRVRTGKGSAGWEIHTFAQKNPGIDRFGFTGSAHESTRKGDKIRWKTRGATRARLYYLDRNQNAPFTIEVDGETLLRVEASGTKSPIDRTIDFEFPASSEQIQLTASGRGVVIYGIALASDEPGAVFDTIGVPASDAKMYLGADAETFTRQLQAREPSMVVLMIGGNEIRSLAYGWTTLEEVEKDYAALIDRVQKSVPEAACLAVAPIDAAKATAAGAELTTRQETLDIVEMERRVAKAKGCGFLNLFAAMGGAGSLHRFHEKGLIHDDLVHPRGKGGDVLGQLFADALLASYRDTPLPKKEVQARRRLVRPKLHGLSFPVAKNETRSIVDERYLGRFFDKLNKLEGGESLRVAIGQFGDVHTEKQALTDRIRERFSERFGSAGRGYIAVGHRDGDLLPGRVTRGLSGPVEITEGRNITIGGAVAMNGTKARLLPESRFDIGFCDGCQEGRYRPRGYLELSWLYTPDMGVADVFVNDVQVGIISPLRRRTESDAQFLRIPVRGEAHTLSVVVRDGRAVDPRRRDRRFGSQEDGLPLGPVNLFGVAGEVNRAGVLVDAMGLAGTSGTTLTRWKPDLIQAQIAARNYDLILPAWGSIEARARDFEAKAYRAKYMRTLEALRSAAPDAECVVVGPLDQLVRVKSQWQAPPAHAQLLEVQKEVAAAVGCAYFDAQKAMGGAGIIQGWVQENLATPDHQVLTREGYAHLADLLLHDLLAQYAYDKARQKAQTEQVARAANLAKGQKPSGSETEQGSQQTPTEAPSSSPGASSSSEGGR